MARQMCSVWPSGDRYGQKLVLYCHGGWIFRFVCSNYALRTSIRYPVCRHHLWLALIAGMISARNLFNLALGVLWAFPAMAVIFVVFDKLFNGAPIKAPDVMLTNSVIAAIGIAVFMFGKRFTPVKLTVATEEAVTISIRDNTYAHEFENLNASIILPTHSTQQS